MYNQICNDTRQGVMKWKFVSLIYLDSRTNAIRISENAGGFRIPIGRSTKLVLDAL